jgi:hypothetical protein
MTEVKRKLAVFIPITEDEDEQGIELLSDGSSTISQFGSDSSESSSSSTPITLTNKELRRQRTRREYEFKSSPFGFTSPKPLIQIDPQKYDNGEGMFKCPNEENENKQTKKARGTQGQVIFDCPAPGLVYKETAFRVLEHVIGDYDLAYNVFEQQCLVQKMLNELAKPNAFVTTESCWFTGTNERPLLHTVQEQVMEAVSARQAILGTSEAKALIQSDAQMAQVLLQVFDAIALLYDHDLFHNDMHAGNVLVQSASSDVYAQRSGDGKEVEQPLQEVLLRVRIIDYGLMTFQFALDQDYQLIDGGKVPFPWLDFAQFVHDVAGMMLPREHWFPCVQTMVILLLTQGQVVHRRDRKSIPLRADLQDKLRVQDVRAILLEAAAKTTSSSTIITTTTPDAAGDKVSASDLIVSTPTPSNRSA